jgi:hypothetical protein
MSTIEAIYQEIAGNAPNRESVARIRRAGRLLNLSETDSGWLLLAVLAAHGSLAQAELQTAATLAASLSIAATEAKATSEALTHASNTATTAIAAATDEATPAFIHAVDIAIRHVTNELKSIQRTVGQSIANIGTETGNTLVTRIAKARDDAGTIITTVTNHAAGNLLNAIHKSAEQAIKDINKACSGLTTAADDAREKTINNWRAAVVTAVSTELSARSLIDTEAAKRRTIRAAALAGGLVGILIAGVGFGAHRIGWQDGKQYGVGKTLAQVHDQRIRASWANTSDGQLAYRLYQGGYLAELATCNAPGWKIETRSFGPLCVPDPARDGSVYGWYLEKAAR